MSIQKERDMLFAYIQILRNSLTRCSLSLTNDFAIENAESALKETADWEKYAKRRKNRGDDEVGDTEQPAWLTVKQLSSRYGAHEATIWRWSREGRFPSPVKLAGNLTRWSMSDIERWESAQKEGGES